MPRPIIFPSPNDATVNNPIRLLSPSSVLAIYNKNNRMTKSRSITPVIKEWIERYALSIGWSKVWFNGNQLLVKANLTLTQ